MREGRKTKYHHNKEYSGEETEGGKDEEMGDEEGRRRKKGEFTTGERKLLCVFLNLILYGVCTTQPLRRWFVSQTTTK